MRKNSVPSGCVEQGGANFFLVHEKKNRVVQIFFLVHEKKVQGGKKTPK